MKYLVVLLNLTNWNRVKSYINKKDKCMIYYEEIYGFKELEIVKYREFKTYFGNAEIIFEIPTKETEDYECIPVNSKQKKTKKLYISPSKSMTEKFGKSIKVEAFNYYIGDDA